MPSPKETSSGENSLVVFDCDGTLLDSAALIVAGLQKSFSEMGYDVPTPDAARRIVGLSLEDAVSRLTGDVLPERDVRALAEAYRSAFVSLRADPAYHSPLFEGTRPMLDGLLAAGHLMGVATGKSAKGLRSVYDMHDLERYFVTHQTADHHPSKPHPSMLEAAMRETGAVATRSVIIGDTDFDIEMGRAAGFRTIGVSWGNHPADELIAAGADHVIDDWAALPGLLASWGIEP